MHGIQYFNVVKILVEKGLAKVNLRNHVQTPLCWAVMKSSIDVVRYLLDHANAELNAVNQYKQTPLMLAILAANDPSITSYLLSRPDIDVNCQDSVSLMLLYFYH
jgi:ankyrin repeat protein